MIDRFLAFLAKVTIRLYQTLVSPRVKRTCLFTPSCSERAFQILSENGFFDGIGRVREQLRDCRAEYSIRWDASDRPELVCGSGRVFRWHELSDALPEPLNVIQHTELEPLSRRALEPTAIHRHALDAKSPPS